MKTKRNKKFIVIGLLFAMVALYGVLPTGGAKAVNSLKDAKDLLSDSSLSASSTHTFTFQTATYIPNNGYTLVNFHTDFGDITAVSNIACSNGTNVLTDTDTARCTHGAGAVATSTNLTVTVSGVTNPANDGDRRMDIETYSDTGAMLDRVSVMVYIIHDVLMTATVDPILEFTISGVGTTAQSVNNINCTATTSATSTQFGTLTVNATTTVCQRLNVTTNADDGFVVTVEQDQELTSDSGSNINSFDNSPTGTGSTTVHTWVAPTNTLDQYHTYGHMGVTSNDQDGAGLPNYYNGGGVAQYSGLNGTAPLTVMVHNGPSDGLAQNIGQVTVAYSAVVASLQEAGDYESVLTYIATATY